MKKIKTQLFQRTYRLFRRYVRWSHHEYRTDEDKLRAKAQFDALYDFIIDSGLEQEYCDWRASLSEEAMGAA
jgi:hypothetical protein